MQSVSQPALCWFEELGAVVNSQGIMQSPMGREHTGIPGDQVIMVCMAVGYPDEEFPANAAASKRRPVAEVASFQGFGLGNSVFFDPMWSRRYHIGKHAH